MRSTLRAHAATQIGARATAVLAVLALIAVGLTVSMGTARAASDYRVNLRVLVLSNGSNPNPDAIAVQLDREGVPYTKVVTTTTGRPTIDAEFLSDPAMKTAKFQAVVISGPEDSGLTTDELTALAAYERTYGVRQVNAYAWPGPDTGMNWPTASGSLDGGTVAVSATARSGPFAYLDASLPIDDFVPGAPEIFGAFAQPLSPLPSGATFTPLLTATVGANSGVLAGEYAYDGREQLTITAGFNQYMQVFNQIAPGIVDWMTRGIHLGYQRNYFAVNIDDVLLPDGRWSVAANCTPGDNCVDPTTLTTDIRMTPADVQRLQAWQTNNDFKLDLTFNSGGIALYGANNDGAADPLAAALLANKADFTWMSHTVDHTYLGCIQIAPTVQGGLWSCATSSADAPRQDAAIPGELSGGTYWASQAYITQQIADNVAWATQNALPGFDPAELVTGEHSGLATLPQMPADSPFFGPALAATGVRYVASDASREREPRAAGPTTVTVPRYPMNIFYNAGTYLDEVDEYNWIYNSRNATPPGGGICDDNSTTSTCIAPLPAANADEAKASFDRYIKPLEVRNALGKVLTNDPRPFYVHQSNLAEDGILYPVLDGILGQYRAAYADNAPLVRLDLTGQSQAMARMAAWNAAKDDATAYIDSTGIQVSGGSTPVPLTAPTGTTGVSLESYGGVLSGWLDGAANATPTTPMGGYVGSANTAPGAPTIGMATMNDTTATITWTPPTDTGGRALTSYSVAIYEGNSATPVRTDTGIDASATSYDAVGLSYGMPYTFTVTATNGAGTSLPSARTTAVTPLPPLPGAPTISEVMAGNASATVIWTPPSTGGAPTGYTVTVYDGTGSTVKTVPVTGGATTTATVDQLVNGTSYTFDVAATNLAGSSPASQRSAAATPMTTPGAPAVTGTQAGNGQATVAWTTPADTGGSPITGYVVTAYQNGTEVATSPALRADPLSYTVTGLTNDVAYTFTVVARNAVGAGAESGPSSPTTPTAPVLVPGAPTITSTITGDRQVTVGWTAPTTGDAPTGYVVTTYQNGTKVATSPALEASPLSYTVTELTNGTAYTFTVGATNSAGTTTSAASGEAIPAPVLTVPGAPTAVTATPGDGKAVVTWADPASNGGTAITAYLVTPYQGSAAGTPVQVFASATSATVEGLTNGTAYTVTVTAVNAQGEGSPSAASNQVTPAALTAPGAPSLASVRAGNGSVGLTWTAPVQDGGSPVTRYRVTTYQGGTAVGNPREFDATTLTTTVDGLINGMPYTFTVAAKNYVDWGAESAASAPLTPTTVPGVPTIGTATAGDASASVAWTPSTDTGGSAPVGFEVRAFAAGGSTPATTVTVGASATSTSVTGLANGTPYTFEVVALNTTGKSAPSGRSNEVTPAAPTASAAPAIGTAVPGDRSASVTWTAPADGGSPITGYVVRAYQGTGTQAVRTVTAGATATTATVTGLTNGTAYTLTVTAQNAVGTGPESAGSNKVTPATLPGAPRIGKTTAGDASATVTWRAPTTDGGTPITGYVISVLDGNGAQVLATVPIEGAVTLGSIPGLVNGTAYRFTVAAVTAAGTGAASEFSNGVTPNAVPAAPSVGAVTPGNRSVTVDWAAPAGGDLQVTGYVVRVFVGDSTVPVRSVTTGRSATGTTVSRLVNGTGYTITVTASNAVGAGVPSDRSTLVTPGTSPAAPRLGPVTAGDGSVTVNWRPPGNTGGLPITGYVVSVYGRSGSQVLRTVTVDGTATSAVVTGLTNGTAYRFAVAAVSDAGTGAKSTRSGRVTPKA